MGKKEILARKKKEKEEAARKKMELEAKIASVSFPPTKTYLILFRIRSKKKRNRTMNGQMTIKIKRMSRIKE